MKSQKKKVQKDCVQVKSIESGSVPDLLRPQKTILTGYLIFYNYHVNIKQEFSICMVT
ncbi:hypothetical protein KKHLCK_12765 [Candidatus Electrothrix laxa]